MIPESPYLYLALDLLTLSLPFAFSFESKVAYYKNWKALFIGIASAMALFIPWDIYFTAQGIWGFNPRYLTGLSLWHLPLEEWLFFIMIPYSCVFIYRSLNYYFPAEPNAAVVKRVARFILWFSMGIAILNYTRWYTLSAFGLLSLFLYYNTYVKPAAWMGKFLRAYAVVLIPFAMVNGILTGSGLEEPIVWYNNAHNLGIRLGTIPLEDAFYGMLLIGINIWVYESLKKQ